ncbi:DUF998 domain-containing protein [Kribbella sp. NPDC056861]|uniref:DUF998 domain-containing protein n=1 Tax=Kribbella sp. NPDC056861 TaxID=3154857 RepID=UPI003423E956
MTNLLSSRRTAIAGGLYLAAGVLLFAIEAAVASAFPGYSYATNYVSDLGVPEVGQFEGRAIDSPLAWLMNLGFIAQGLLVLAATATLFPALRDGWGRRVLLALATVFAIGFVTIAIFHGSEQAEADGTVALHFLGGGLLAASGNALLIVTGIAARRFGAPLVARATSIALGLFGLTSLALLSIDKANTSISILGEGALERGALYAILVWELTVGAILVWTTRRSPAQQAVAWS